MLKSKKKNVQIKCKNDVLNFTIVVVDNKSVVLNFVYFVGKSMFPLFTININIKFKISIYQQWFEILVM